MESKSTSWKAIDYLALLLVSAGVGASLFPLRGKTFYWLESHACELMLALLGAGMIFFFFNLNRLMIIAFAGCALLSYNLHLRTDGALKSAESREGALSLRVATFRLSAAGADFESTLGSIRELSPDVLTLQDIDPSVWPRTRQFLLNEGYSTIATEPAGDDAPRLALCSRQPIVVQRQIHNRSSSSILGRLTFRDIDTICEFTLLATILPSPDSLEDLIYDQLQTLGRQLGHSRRPVLAMGNFHFVSWAKPIQSFKALSAMQDSRRGIRPVSRQGHLNLFRHSTDHIFYSRQLKCVSFETISSGSASGVGIVGTFQLSSNGRFPDVQPTSQEF